MPTVHFGSRDIDCEAGAILRDVLREAGESPHNGASRYLNCGGHATCGTCAVEVDGEVSEMGDAKARRLSLPPHDADSGLRLSCQTEVLGDVRVTKHGGFWGQKIREPTAEEQPQD